ncbi:hypothetical protein ASG73_06600 [Janibacter sp. Soil728]|uniref:T3SS (YopN, CesT) and YbjN peptide-binding chaperone 1 n=1 Tax=Janibacter sp. Soil728 TaxID=1736393 RepID=UPI0006FBFFFB|nr:YbjN domain-containing protein [Janibacter sp. Soil728]KRE38588.1 hypothetical protein ASG73_06600 [Janibacter sp. Soil728]
MSDPTALPNFGPTPTNGGAQPEPETPLSDRVQDALRELGLEPSVDDEGDIAFLFSEQQMFVRCQDDESNVLRVFGQWALEDPVPTDPMERLQVSNDLNVAFNLVKAAVAGDTLLVTSEHILPRGADVRGLLGLALPLVLQGVQLWHQRATGQDPDEQGAPDGGTTPDAGEPQA